MSTDEPWYKDGLKFKCTQCGNCCTGEPGYVWVTEEEMQAIADFTKEPLEEVKQLKARKAKGRYTLREKANGDCVYLGEGKGCTIYEVRPVQCRTWPFWESTVGTPEDWEETKKVCPGSGQGDLISSEEITMRLKQLRL